MRNLLAPLVTEKDKHRLHDRLSNLLVLITSITLAIKAFSGHSIDWKPDSSVGMECNAFNLKIHFALVGPVEAILNNQRLERIELAVQEIPSKPVPQGEPVRVIDIFSLAMEPIFVEFFETHRPWLEANVGSVNKWPSTLSFARVIRNAMSHGGSLKMSDKKAQSVKWRHLTYTDADDGKRVYGLGPDLFVSDILFLMFDASDELDALGCPFDPL
jgi:hypothetical protein